MEPMLLLLVLLLLALLCREREDTALPAGCKHGGQGAGRAADSDGRMVCSSWGLVWVPRHPDTLTLNSSRISRMKSGSLPDAMLVSMVYAAISRYGNEASFSVVSVTAHSELRRRDTEGCCDNFFPHPQNTKETVLTGTYGRVLTNCDKDVEV